MKKKIFPWLEAMNKNPNQNFNIKSSLFDFISWSFKYFLSNRKKKLNDYSELEVIFQWMFELKKESLDRVKETLLILYLETCYLLNMVSVKSQ